MKLAPVFYPTIEEFKNPVEYFQKITSNLDTGILKIVPPKEFKMSKLELKDDFEFHSRIQELNELSGQNRIKMTYIDGLVKFFTDQHKKIQIPYQDNEPLDPWLLKQTMMKFGGYQKVKAENLWSQLAREIIFDDHELLKSFFEKFLLPFEQYRVQNGFPGDHSTLNEQRRTRNAPKNIYHLLSHRKELNKSLCFICQTENQLDLTCQNCHLVFHSDCLQSHKKQQPKPYDTPTKLSKRLQKKQEPKYFQCPICILVDIPLFIENGQKWSLSKFKAYALESEKENLTKEKLESEFWKILHQQQPIKVHYGSDLNSPHSAHSGGWSLFDLPKHPLSLLHHFSKNVSGMTLPWLYIGMRYSAFCFHAEDHYLYSINYLHKGQSKVWYGIPSSQARQLEAAFRFELPELFLNNQSLLFDMTTMLSPEVLERHQLDVYHLEQKPGELVITLPQAYHGGFNQGFNVAEAVNFAFENWLPYGLQCTLDYHHFKREPIFSHDQLIFELFQTRLGTHPLLLEQCQWILKRESQYRKMFKLKSEYQSKVSQQCQLCKRYLYCSYVSCSNCHQSVYCVECLNQSQIKCCSDSLPKICLYYQKLPI